MMNRGWRLDLSFFFLFGFFPLQFVGNVAAGMEDGGTIIMDQNFSFDSCEVIKFSFMSPIIWFRFEGFMA